MARRNRGVRERSQQATARVESQIERRLPFFDPLDDDAVVRLEAQVDWIIQDVGIAFRDDPEALALWREQPDVRIEEDVVRAPADWVRELCRQAPSSFTQLARNPERSVTIGGHHQVLRPSTAPRLCATLRRGGAMATSRRFRISSG